MYLAPITDYIYIYIYIYILVMDRIFVFAFAFANIRINFRYSLRYSYSHISVNIRKQFRANSLPKTLKNERKTMAVNLCIQSSLILIKSSVELDKGIQKNTKESTNNNRPIGPFEAVCKEEVKCRMKRRCNWSYVRGRGQCVLQCVRKV